MYAVTVTYCDFGGQLGTYTLTYETLYQASKAAKVIQRDKAGVYCSLSVTVTNAVANGGK